MHRQIAGKLTGPVTKWLVVGFWIVLFVVASGFAAKLTDVQNNESSSWLPGDAESTLALDRLSVFQDPDEIPTTVVYERDGGLTDADRTAIKSQAAEIQALEGVDDKVIAATSVPTGISEDGEVAQTLVNYNFGKDGWSEMPDAVDKLREVTTGDEGLEVHVAGAGGQAADSAEAFEGLDSTLLFAAAGVVIVILLLTYRSPVLWMLPVFSAVVALFVA